MAIDFAKRRQIIEWPDSVRNTARHFKVSPTTVWLLRNSKKGRVTAPHEQFAALPDHLRQLLAEYVRLSRFPQRQWVEFLGPVLPGLPTAHRKNAWKVQNKETPGGSSKNRMWSYKLLNGELHRELGPGRLAQTPALGSWAVHLIKVDWEQQGGEGRTKKASAEILCLMERGTGMIYLRGFERLQPSGISEAIFRFFTVCPIDIETLIFVGKKIKGKTVSTAGLKDGKRLKKLLSVREEFPEDDYNAVVEEPLGPTAGKRIFLPWSFTSVADLNRHLTDFANRYNTQRRESLEGGDSWRLYTPRERLWAAYQSLEGIIKLSRSRFDKWTTLSRHAKLRRRWHTE